MFCTACATENPAAVQRCAGCGGRLDASIAPPAPGSPSSRRPAAGNGSRGRGADRAFLAVLLVVPLLAVVAALALYERAEREEGASWYARAETELAAGRFDQALAAFAAAAGHRDFHAWVGTENYEMRVSPDLSWIDQRVLAIVRSQQG